VIYDGLCEFCEQSLSWVRQRAALNALAFQSTDLSPYNLTTEQCARQVYVIAQGQTLGGAAAIAYLLKRRGNKILSRVITFSGPLGRAGYRWVAAHRNSLLIKIVTKLLKRLNA
jgi:predicted DCC family thiol-disulfide oxidoreductase YuxK